ncbi:sensor histidine kinase [Metabacillus sp. RGM 3146]|uniref:sensor histidine kinase n=1 Tax=Metabacillus sp. RGM 3146 TaxID=3401092 RepID=UPI003B9A7055
MSILVRQIFMSCFISVSVLAGLIVSYIIVIPTKNAASIWNLTIMDMPFYLFCVLLSILIGIIYGLSTGIHLKKQLDAVTASLHQLENGKLTVLEESHAIPEFQVISQQLNKVKNHLSEQTKLSQKLANEKAVDQEKRMQEIVSQERQRLARELHDSVSQQLFAASMMMSAINEGSGPKEELQAKQLKMVESMIHQSQLEMRALLLHLRPAALKGKSLKEGMEELLIELSQKVQMDVTWKVESLELDKGIEDHLFRILQESVSNTLRHAKAQSLHVLLIERDQLVILRVSDDGIGFNMETEKTGSYGLQNMRERAIELGGTLKVISLPGNGTRLEVKVPILKQEEEKR